MADDTGNTDFIIKQKASKAAGVLTHVMAIIAYLVVGTICFCEIAMCFWHMKQADFNYAIPNELWLLAANIVTFFFGKKIGEDAAKAETK